MVSFSCNTRRYHWPFFLDFVSLYSTISCYICPSLILTPNANEIWWKSKNSFPQNTVFFSGTLIFDLLMEMFLDRDCIIHPTFEATSCLFGERRWNGDDGVVRWGRWNECYQRGSERLGQNGGLQLLQNSALCSLSAYSHLKCHKLYKISILYKSIWRLMK